MRTWLSAFSPAAHLRKKSYWSAFFISLCCLIFLPSIGFSWKIHYFLPPLIIAGYQRSILFCLWFALLAGVLTGSMGGAEAIGIYPFAYTCATLMIWKYKHYFFADSISTLPVLTGLSSIVTTSVIAIFLFLLDKSFTLSIKLFLYDCILMSLADTAFATIVFTLPAYRHFLRRSSAQI